MFNYLGGDNLGINIQGSRVENTTITNTVLLQQAADRPVPAELPRQPSLFVGRADELARIEELADRVGTEPVVVVVEGAPGVGKTGLLQHVAHTLAPRFADGRLYVDLRCFAPGTSPVTAHEVLGRFLTSLGVPRSEIPAGTDERAARFRTEAASLRLLVVLDNAGDPAVVRDLLPGGNDSLVLIGSRQQLASLEPSAQLHLPVLDDAESAELVVRVVGERAEAEPAMTRELARLCGNLPLALRIACARLVSRPAWSVQRLVSALTEERRRLAGLKVGDLEIRAAFSLSYRALDPVLARVFRVAGLHPGPDWTAEAMADTAELDSAEVADALDGLLSAHLVEQDVADRFRLHDLVKLFAREQAEDTDGSDAVQAGEKRLVGHFGNRAAHCAALVRANVFVQPDDRAQSLRATALDWFDAEVGNCAEVLRLAAERGWLDEASALAGSLVEYLELRGVPDVMEAVCRVRLEVERARSDVHQEVHTLGRLASVELDRHNLGKAAELFSQARELSRRVGDEELETLVSGNEATLYTSQGRMDAAAEVFERCIVHNVRRNDFDLTLRNLGNLGNVLAASERWGEAIGAYRMCEKLASALAPRVLPRIYENLAKLLHDQGTDLETALEYARRARDLCTEWDDHPGKASAQLILGHIQVRLGLIGEAADAFDDVRRLGGKMGDPRTEGAAVDALATVAVRESDWEKALGLLEEVLRIRAATGDREERARTLRNIGAVLFEMDREREGGEVFAEAVEEYGEVGMADFQAVLAGELAGKWLAAGDPVAAGQWFARQADLARNLGDAETESSACLQRAQLEAQTCRHSGAVTWYRRALSVCTDSVSRCRALANLGMAHLGLGDTTEAIACFRQSLENGEAAPTMEHRGRVLLELGEALNDTGEFDTATGYLEAAVRWFEENDDDTVLLGRALDQLGIALGRRGLLQDAVVRFNAAAVIWQREADLGRLAVTFQSFGLCCAGAGALSDAQSAFEQALEVRRQLGDVGGEAFVHGCLGMAHAMAGRRRQARRHYRRGLKLYRSIDDRRAEEFERELAGLAG